MAHTPPKHLDYCDRGDIVVRARTLLGGLRITAKFPPILSESVKEIEQLRDIAREARDVLAEQADCDDRARELVTRIDRALAAAEVQF